MGEAHRQLTFNGTDIPSSQYRAMLSFCEAALSNICEKSCQIFLTIGSKSVTIITTYVNFRKYLALAQA